MAKEYERLATEIAELTKRVEELEGSTSKEPSVAPTAAKLDADTFWALNGLRARIEQNSSSDGGEVILLGSVTLPDGTPAAWQQGAETEALLESDWSDFAATFASLGHPVRLELLRHILAGTHSTAELGDQGSLGTTGQLHHHLRQLVATGWVRQSGRGSYEVPASRIVPLLVMMAGAQR
ncbi:MAG TPA: helix-turn-helix domain-containing protein [Dietzia timorensis]|uniref:Helix-turn-helix domain-containing protein n=1 Tax=Dietzia timorensis TaxID=499555 RepID=A0A921JZ78_9ACTN|nr:helix-turn-helix domain-containing protein [Dietzia timorensis]HJE92075.1 helix-turn-helix domain-containing protein [Dietzia timorensis]